MDFLALTLEQGIKLAEANNLAYEIIYLEESHESPQEVTPVTWRVVKQKLDKKLNILYVMKQI